MKKKITLLISLFFMFTWHGNAQALNENFDGSTFPPYQWSLDNVGGDNFTQSNVIADHTSGTGKFANYDCYLINNGNIGYLISPTLNVTATDNIFSFWVNYYLVYGNYGSAAELYVDVSGDGGTTWTLGTTNYLIGHIGTGWFQVSIDLTNYEGHDFTGNNTIVRFRAISDFGSYNIAIDDVTGPNIVLPPCPEPGDLAANQISQTAVELSWTEYGSATSWEIEYGPTGFSQGSGTTVSTSNNPHTLSGLTAGQSYDFYVRSDCGGGTFSNWAGPYTWQQPNYVNDICSGAQTLTVYPQGGGAGNETLATTTNAINSGQDPSCFLSGYDKADLWYSFTAPTSGYVKVITGGAQGNVLEAAVYDGCGGNEISCHIFGYGSTDKNLYGLVPGQTYILQVWHYSWDVGDFSIVLEEFTPPSNDDCANAIEVSDPLPYNNTQDATNATNNGGYVADCGNGMNDGVWYKFTTGTVNGDITIEVVPQGWDAEVSVYTGSCSSFTCVDYADNVGTGGTETITFTPSPNTDYYVNIGYFAFGGDGPEGPYTITLSGNVTLNMDKLSEGDFSFYPNPARSIISWNASGTVEKIQITNLTGQVVMEVENPVNNFLNITKLNQGVYLIHVFMDDKEGIYKLIKE